MAQMTSAIEHEANIKTVRALAREAAEAKCDLVALPEAAGMFNRDANVARRHIVAPEEDPFIAACQDIARKHRLYLHTGSTPVKGKGGKFLNRSNLVGPDGALLATYDKIHLFDVQLEGSGRIGESERYDPGNVAVLANTPWGEWGLSICYDIRFPGLYRAYAKEGADMLFVPSAFTVETGQAHWKSLLRARAIENGAWLIAAAQVGQHDDGRRSWGHSMVVDPWGTVRADLGGVRPAYAIIDLDLSLAREARRQIPSLANERVFDLRRDPPRAHQALGNTLSN